VVKVEVIYYRSCRKCHWRLQENQEELRRTVIHSLEEGRKVINWILTSSWHFFLDQPLARPWDGCKVDHNRVEVLPTHLFLALLLPSLTLSFPHFLHSVSCSGQFIAGTGSKMPTETLLQWSRHQVQMKLEDEWRRRVLNSSSWSGAGTLLPHHV
jgi:hypothetical protein